VNGQDGVPGVVLLVEEGAELGVRQSLIKADQGGLDLRPDVLTFRQEFRENLKLVLFLLDLAEELEVPLEQFLFLLEGLRGPLVLPDFGRGEPLVDGFPFGLLAVEVKESPAALRTWRRCRRGAS
jgi:hypothetical protein